MQNDAIADGILGMATDPKGAVGSFCKKAVAQGRYWEHWGANGGFVRQKARGCGGGEGELGWGGKK